jgi:hypothetical protein
MAHKDGVYAGHLGRNCHRPILIRYLSWVDFSGAHVFFQTHMHCDYDNVRSLFLAHNRDPLLRFANWFTKL